MTVASDEPRIWGLIPDELADLLVPLFESLPRGSDDELVSLEDCFPEFVEDEDTGSAAG